MTEVAKPGSDLKVRTLSAIVMVAVAGGALWQGGWAFGIFTLAIGLGVLWEYWGLVHRIAASSMGRGLWMAAGLVYVGSAILALIALRNSEDGVVAALTPIVAVIAVDIGAYFSGRTFGGPKIAPAISPSKTWAGLIGGMISATLVLYAMISLDVDGDISSSNMGMLALGLGVGAAVVAQSGDFFESWMKRRAGVKDSGALIPGHGGLFDRVDGLIAVLCAVAIIYRAF